MIGIEDVDVKQDASNNPVDGNNAKDDIAEENGSKELVECCNLMGLDSSGIGNDIRPKLKLFCGKYKEVLDQLFKLSEERDSLSNDIQNYVKRCKTLEDAVKITNENCKQKVSEVERKALEYENSLKSAREKMASMEAHHNRYLEELSTKTNQSLSQLTKKLEMAEKEKNDTVVRYAIREAEIMRLKSDNEKYSKEKEDLVVELTTLRNSTDSIQLDKLKRELEESRGKLVAERKVYRDKDAEYQMAMKRIEAGQTAINELKITLGQTQKQLSKENEEKNILNENYKKLVQQLQAMEEEKTAEIERAKKELLKKDELCEETLNELSLARNEKKMLDDKFNELTDKHNELVERNDLTEQEFSELKTSHDEAMEKLHLLEDIHTQVNSSLRRAEEAEKDAEAARSNMDQAELEANECRRQAERMLEVTRQLTERNSALSSECETLKDKLEGTRESLRKSESELRECKASLDFTKDELSKCQESTTSEIAALKSSLVKRNKEIDELLKKLDEANNEKEVIKKKNASFIKELRAELHTLRRKQTSCSYAAEQEESESISLPVNGHLAGSTSSRASSVSSVDLASRGTNGSPPPTTTSIENTSVLQQQMVEKIVKLQKTLAKKQEKIEFLEEHVQQCTHELCKKTKIIQNYALREEAALLLPVEDALNKLLSMCEVVPVPLSRRTGGMSLMGSMFSSGDKKTELELATEVNSRLQAVLEDTLYKNITLKTNIDTLGEEIARLSRENRQLSLQKANDL